MHSIFFVFIFLIVGIMPALSCDMQEFKKMFKPYPTDSVTCHEGKPTWIISNKRFMLRSQRGFHRTPSSIEPKQEIIKSPKVIIRNPKIGFQYSFNFGSASIKSVDSVSNVEATAVSDIVYGVTLSWQHLWSKRLNAFFVGSAKNYNFRVSDSREISQGAITQGFVGVGLSSQITKDLSFSSVLGIGDSLVLESDGDANITVEKLVIPSFSLSTKYTWFEFESGFNIGSQLRLGGMHPSDTGKYEVSSGYFYAVGFSSQYKKDDKFYSIGTMYIQREFEIDDAKQTTRNLELSVGFGWQF